MIVNVPDVVNIADVDVTTADVDDMEDVEDAEEAEDVTFDDVGFEDIVGGAVATGAPLYELGAGGPVSTAGSAR